jgi:2-oxoglutarate ferredoxin oxidoreductase subunit alpha
LQANKLSSLKEIEIESVVIKFAGDSGDGMQVTGGIFTSGSALAGNDIATFPDFPAEIRAPIGTVAGVSGFQIRFGSIAVHTPGDECDVLVAMNAAALKSNLSTLKNNGIIIVNSQGFDARNLRLAGYPADATPLEHAISLGYNVINVDLSKVARETLADKGLGTKETERGKNMVALGLISWMYHRPLDTILALTEQRFGKKGEWSEWNKLLVKAGWNFGETIELFHERYNLRPASMKPGVYRGIAGNEALALGLLAASQKAGRSLFLGAYPITPASDVLHELAKYKRLHVDTFMAEDEIAAICASIGASYGGSLGVTVSSGPGIALKTEAMGLAIALELPLVICNIQRGGPSTGLPTKTEQADLFQAVLGRNGESPLIVIAPGSPKECFEMAFWASKLSLEHTTPVMLLSDGYIANGAEPWCFPSIKNLPVIVPAVASDSETPYLPYERDENLVRKLAVPGTKGMQHRIGGLEKQARTGNISYDPDNHEQMVWIRKRKVENIARFIPPIKLEQGSMDASVLILGWGSTLGAITTAVEMAQNAGLKVAQAHLRFIHPFPENMATFLAGFTTVLVPEMNTGQLAFMLKATFPAQVVSLSKIKGKPFSAKEIFDKILTLVEPTQHAQ